MLVVTGAATGAKTSAAAASKVKVTLGEFVVQAKPKSAPAGNVDFVVTNKGSMTHEFVVARTTDGTLPVDADGMVDESQLPEGALLGELEDMGRGDKATLDLKGLTPGSYVLFCNIKQTHDGVTEIHYKEGMSTPFTVK